MTSPAVSEVGTYIMTLSAVNSKNTSDYIDVNFTVYVYCDISESYSGASSQTYTIGSGNLSYPFTSLLYTSSCSPTYNFSYISEFSNGTALPTFIAFNSTSMDYYVDSTNTSL